MKKLISLLLVFIALYAQAQKTPDLKKAQGLLHKNTKLFFIENKGQWPDEVLFMTKTNGMDAWITKTGVVYDFYQLVEREKSNQFLETNAGYFKQQQTIKDKKGHIVKFNLLQCNKNVVPEGNYKQEAYYNYFIDNDKSKWASFVALYNEVVIKNIYDGIDIRYYFDEGSLRYDYIVHPGANPKQIQFNMEGADQISLNNAGEIVINTTIGETKQTELYSYQNLQHKKQTIQSFFKKLNSKTFAIALGTYDNSKPLIIDPLVFATFLGCSFADDTKDVATDQSNNIVMVGITTCAQMFPTTLGSYRPTAPIFNYTGKQVVISKLSSNGDSLIFSTFLGAICDSELPSVVLDSIGNVYIGGEVKVGSSFPTTLGCYDSINAYPTSGFPTNYTAYDGFITKLNSTGSALVYSTFFGGGWAESIKDIAIDNLGNAYVIGTGGSIPTTIGSYDISTSGGFLAKLNPSGSALVFCTSFKATPRSIAIDNFGNAIIAGNASNSLITTSGSYDPTYNGGGEDGFILKFNNIGSSLVFSTFIGGTNAEYINSVKTDSLGTIYFAGYTYSGNFPTTLNAYDSSWNGGTDIVLGKLNSTGSNLSYSTFIGTTGYDYGNAVAIDNTGNMHLTGYTSSANYPTTTGSFDRSFNGGYSDVLFTKLNNTGSQIMYSTYLGGQSSDEAKQIVFDNNKNIIIAGNTSSNNFPVTAGAFDTDTNSSGGDIFIAKFKNCIFSVNSLSNQVVTMGSGATFIVSGSYAAGATFQWQQNNGTGFTNLSNVGPFTGTTSNTLNISSTNFSFNNTQYRCIVSNGACGITSDTAILTINCLFNITRQATNQTINQGSNTQFSVAASSPTASYQWQQNTGTGFVNLVNNAIFSNVIDDTLIINATPITFNNTSFRCIVTDNACSVTSNAVNLTVNCTLAVSRQPIPLSILVNSNNQFSVATNTPGATFQWQQSLGTGFSNLSNNTVFSNVNDDTLIITNTLLSLNNTRYRCIITNGPCSKTSDSVSLNVNCFLTVNTQPVNKNIPAESNTIISVNASGFAPAFQWQQNTGSGFVNLTNNSTFSNVNDDTLLINNANYNLNNSTYRCIITDGPCSITSNAATLLVYCISSITRQVANSNTYLGNNALFSLTCSNNSATFQWQQNTGPGFVNIINGTQFSGANDDTLIITNTTLLQNNNIYRCLVSTGSCIDTSSIGTLTVSCNLNFVTQPVNQSVINGSNAQFIATSNKVNAIYQWQQNTGTGFVNIFNTSLFSGVNNDTLTLSGASFSLNNSSYRCKINENGCFDSSNIAVLTINCPSSITLQPNSQTTNISNNISFIVNSNNPTAAFQWQVNTGTGFINLNNNTQFSGVNNDTLAINNVSFAQNNHLYRCIINNNGCPDTSANANLTVNCNLSITSQPVNKNIAIGNNALFVVNSNYTLAQFQWQINNGTGFVNLNNNSTYSGCNDDSLIVNGVSMSLNNTSYRCVVSYLGCSINSNNVLLTVNCVGFIINQPNNVTANIATNVSFTTTAPTSSLFQWQQNNGSGFTNLSNSSQIVGVTNNVLNLLNINHAQNNFSYRCITSYKGCTDTSNIVNLTVNCVSLISSQPINKSVNVGANTSFEIASGLINSSFQWQINDGSGFNNILNSVQFSGANNNIVNINSVSFSQNNTNFRCIVSNSGCSDTSIIANLTANCISTIITQPVNKSANVAGNTQFSINSSNINAGFQWQVNDGNGFNNITSNSQFSGTNSNTLNISNIQLAQNNSNFRCIVNNLGCFDTSNVVTLSTNCINYISRQPNNMQINIQAPAFIIIASSTNASTFQWQQNTGSGFVNLSTSSLYSGINNDTLIITATPLSFNNYGYRCIVNTNGCFDTSNAAVLTVNCNLNILLQPTSSIVNSGSSTKFIIKCNSATATYQWQQNTGSGFVNILNSSLFNGAKDDTLEIVSANMSLNNNSFRCIITDGVCTTTSNGANLTVNCFINFVNQPTSTTKGVGQDAIFFTNTSSTTATYQWQENNGSGFVNLNNSIQYTGADTKYLTVNRVTKSQNGNSYRCVISDGICTFYSNTVFLNTNCAPLIAIQPNNSNAINGNNVTFSVTSINNLTNYQWQENNGGGFVNLSNTGQYSGVNLSTLTISAVSYTQNNYLYRCITNYGGCSDTSSNAKLAINCAKLITSQPQNTSIQLGNNAQFYVKTSGSNLNFQWQQNSGTGFLNLSNFGIYSGVNKDTLSISNVNLLMNNNGYRCVAYNSTCFDTSNYAILNVTNTGTKNITETIVNIYPNPNNGHFKIDGLPNNATIIITNLLGETVSKQLTNNKEVNIDLSNIADGMYLVKVEADNYSMIRKITIAK